MHTYNLFHKFCRLYQQSLTVNSLLFVETVLFQLLLEYVIESDNVFSMHREIVCFAKEIIFENGKNRGFRSLREKTREVRKDDEFFFFSRK